MTHDHDIAGHVTKTFGRFPLLPVPFMWVIRLDPKKRANLPVEEKMRIMDVCQRWISRWAYRNNYTWGNPHVAQTASDDALVMGFLALQGLPEDWLCLGGMVGDLYRDEHDHSGPAESVVEAMRQMGFRVITEEDLVPDGPRVRPN
jgi:hypothetical protein